MAEEGDVYLLVEKGDEERNMSGSAVEEEQELDLFRCGRCKDAFFDMGEFMSHKSTCGLLPPAKPTDATAEMYAVVEEANAGGNDEEEFYLAFSESEEGEEPEERMVRVVSEANIEQMIKQSRPKQKRRKLKRKRGRPSKKDDGGDDDENDSQYKCLECGQTFAKLGDMEIHVRIHTGERPHQCLLCGKGFSQKGNANKHMETHKVWPDYVNSSSVVGSSGSNASEPAAPPPQPLKEEVVTTTNTMTNTNIDTTLAAAIGKPAASSIPAGSVQTKTSMLTAEKGKKIQICLQKSFVCQFCSEEFTQGSAFKAHLNKKHAEEKRYSCFQPNCLAMFATLSDITEHLDAAHKGQLQYPCPVPACSCGQTFSSLDEISLHEFARSKAKAKANRQRSKAKSHVCLLCKLSFATAKSLHQHQKTMPHNVRCGICEKRFPNNLQLKAHAKHMHSEPEPAASSSSSSSSSSSADAIADADVKSRTCPICGKVFGSSFYLRSHLLIHTGEQPFACQVCSAKFNRKDKLRRHELSHTSKRMVCPFRENTGCQRVFYRYDKLQKHVAVHGSGCELKCKSCPEVFGNYTDLTAHKRRAHPTVPQLKCFKCTKTFKREKQRQLHHEQVHGIIHTLQEVTEEDVNDDDDSNFEDEEAVEEEGLTDVVIYVPSVPSVPST